jgi:hypothetical protein
VAVRARTPVSTELFEVAVIEGCTASRYRIARWLVAIELYRPVSFWALSEACMRNHGGNHAYEAKTDESDDRTLRFVHVLYSFVRRNKPAGCNQFKESSLKDSFAICGVKYAASATSLLTTN